ncbi:hypothetical protein PPS11_01709 [Pseudomonas putida S11]|nr:hypothetical protein PPS11_01709 [Pseudomonas putida S11]
MAPIFVNELLQLRMLQLKLHKLCVKSFSTLSMGWAFQIVAKRHGFLPRLSRMLRAKKDEVGIRSPYNDLPCGAFPALAQCTSSLQRMSVTGVKS